MNIFENDSPALFFAAVPRGLLGQQSNPFNRRKNHNVGAEKSAIFRTAHIFICNRQQSSIKK
jgi:hypothetical protein